MKVSVDVGTAEGISVINPADARVLKGQRAWASIKTTAAEQRELWRQVGEARAFGCRMVPTYDHILQTDAGAMRHPQAQIRSRDRVHCY
jgi:hypothetical protein